MDSTAAYYDYEQEGPYNGRLLPSSPRHPGLQHRPYAQSSPHSPSHSHSQVHSSSYPYAHPYLEESAAGPDGLEYFLHEYPPPPTPATPGSPAIGYHRPIRVMPPSSPIAGEDEPKGLYEAAPYSPANTLVGSPHFKEHSSPSSSFRLSDPKRLGADPRILTFGDAQYQHHQTWSSLDHSSTLPDESGIAPPPADAPAPAPSNKKGMRFWLIMSTLMVVMFLSAIDLTIISTALPTIIEELPRSSISGTWVTSSFLLTVTAFQPLMGGLADVLGRRNSLLLSIAFFLGGSVICALAHDMLILVVGRGVQGVGGGGIQAIVEIIISDITTLRERGLYMGAMGLVFAISSLIAPILGGVFSKHDWRWIFWLNLPIGGVASILCVPFLKLRRPPMDLKAQFHRMDIFGNFVLFGSVVSTLIAVTEGGIEHPWTDLRIYVPLIVGIVGLIAFFLIEFLPNPLAKDPILPLRLFVHPTAAISFFLTFLHGIIFYGAVYVMPVYFQAIKGASPLQSAFDILPSTSPAAPAAVVAGLIMAISGKYKVQMIGWWMLMTVGFGLIYLFDIDTPKWEWVFFQLLAGIAIGAIFALTLPPIQACLPVSEIAHATATFAFSRSFGSVWGIAIATAIFTSKVSPKLAAIPGAAEAGLTGQTALGFATMLKELPPELQAAVKPAFASALRSSFLFFIPLCAVGVIACFFLKDIPLPDFNDSEHGIRNSLPPPPRMPSIKRKRDVAAAALEAVGPTAASAARDQEKTPAPAGGAFRAGDAARGGPPSRMPAPHQDGAADRHPQHQQQHQQQEQRPPQFQRSFSHLERHEAPSPYLSSDSTGQFLRYQVPGTPVMPGTPMQGHFSTPSTPMQGRFPSMNSGNAESTSNYNSLTRGAPLQHATSGLETGRFDITNSNEWFAIGGHSLEGDVGVQGQEAAVRR